MRMFDTKYNFERVLVANTSLLLAPPEGDKNATTFNKQPDILILNNKLNKCLKSRADSSPCFSCCLQIESSEFRRRSSALANQPDQQAQCLATCSDKRSVNIELRARAQMSGKLVILAVTEVEGSLLNCRLENSWPFYKFNPKLQNSQDQQVNRNKQTYYARLNSHQSASLAISSMTIDRSVVGSELISLTLETQRPRKNQQVVSKETLLVNEFICLSPAVIEQNSSNLTAPITKNVVHLLALINRDPPVTSSQSNFVKPVEVRTSTIRKQNSTEGGSTNQASVSKEPTSTVTSSPKEEDSLKVAISTPSGLILFGSRSDVDNEAQQNKRAVLVSSTSSSNNPITPEVVPVSGKQTTVAPRASIETSSENSPGLITVSPQLDTFRTVLSQRMDSSATMNVSTNNLPKTTSAPNQFRSSSINQGGLSEAGVMPKIGPPYITELESIRMRLKSNSLLTFTVSSFFVILTYTLCLLIYLRSRRRHNQTTKTNQSTSSATPSNQTLRRNSKRNDNSANSNQNNIEISEPFNLQMPPATKTRLDMMLGLNRKRKVKRQRMPTLSRSSWQSSHGTENLDSDFCDNNHHYSHCLQPDCLLFAGPEHFNNQLYEDVPEFNDSNHHFDPFAQGHLLADTCRRQQYYTYAPINVVDAIKEAATIAKIRFKTSSFKPNLNVIPESDLEYLQHSPDNELEMLASFLTNNNLDHELMSTDQFESLVQEAMSNECSHVSNEMIYEQGATLFSKPQTTFPQVSTDRPISRSRILQQVINPHQESQECIYDYTQDK